MPLHGEVRIGRPAGDVFDLLADGRNEPSWNPQMSRAELITPGPIGLGSSFTTVHRGRSYDATITAYDRPHLLGFHVTAGGLDVTATFRFTADGGETVLASQFDFRPQGLLRLVFPLLSGTIGKDLPRREANFKAFCERAALEP